MQPGERMSEKEAPRRGTLWDELKRPATAIAIALAVLSTIIGIIASLYLYHKGEKRAEIAFAVEQVQVFDKNHVGVVPLTVHDEASNVIDNNIYAASVTIWNYGNTEIQKEDVREAYRLVVEGGAPKIIDISPIFFSRNNADDFSVNRSTGEISWQHFDEGEGLKLRMVYVNQAMANIALKGYSVKTTVVDGHKLEQQRAMFAKYANDYIIYIALVLATLFVLTVIHFSTQLKRPLKQTALLIILGMGAGLGIVLYARPPVVPQPPF
jgi:hypothetical protein